jgi:serine/threonine protein kinase
LKVNRDSGDYIIKVTDFGLACFADGMNRVEHVAGTPFYMAPEIIKNIGYNQNCDVWSIGVLFYLLLCNYSKDAEDRLQDMIKAGKIDYPNRYWAKVDPGGF